MESRLRAQGASAPAASAGFCDWCRLELGRGRVIERDEPDGRHARYCCLGCAFLARHLPAPGAATIDPGMAAAEGAPPPARAQIEVRGMVCTACAQLLEHRLRQQPGVLSVAVDFLARRAFVVHDPSRCPPSALDAAVRDSGLRVARDEDASARRRAGRIELLRLLIAWLSMMQVMMLAAPSYVTVAGELSPGIEQLLRIGQLVLAMPVLLFSAAPFWRAAWRQVRARVPGMEVPVALGLAAAGIASVRATLLSDGPVYFDSVTMFVALLLAVRWWQDRALQQTALALDEAARRDRPMARRLVAWPASMAVESVEVDALRPGDRVSVPAGELVPADGRLVSGATAVSQAWITGEFAPSGRFEGDALLAGSLNVGRPVVVEVERAGDASSFAVLQRMVVEAAGARPRARARAQRVAAAFAPVVLALSLVVAVFWLFVDPSRAARGAIAVLIVTCPCALSLAAPLAVAMARARLSALGIVVARPAALETLAQARCFAFDKTGTLTEGRHQLVQVQRSGGLGEADALVVCAGLEAHSTHPIAQALVRAAHERGQGPIAALQVVEEPGDGIEGIVAGRSWRLGRAGFALGLLTDEALRSRVRAELDRASAQCAIEGASEAVLVDETGLWARMLLTEHLRAQAPELLRELAASGRRLLLLSGDREQAVAGVARTLGVGAALELAHDCTPTDKRRRIAQWQAEGRQVVMVGDGMNDAPVLAQADVSIAIAEGSRAAQFRADFLLPGAHLGELRTLLQMAGRARRIEAQNLAWAIAYNLGMVPLAAMGLLAPWLAAAGMAASSAAVFANSLRLRRARES